MPAIWTHLIHGDRVLRELNIGFEEDSLLLFHLGTQGPNVFFYHESEEYKTAGHRLHNHKCGNFLTYLSENLFEDFSPYVYGIICHHTLDRLTHPYIISRAGNSSKHTDLEEVIDIQMVKRFLKISIDTLNPLGILPEEVPEIIDQLYATFLYDVFRIDGISFSEAYNRMREMLTRKDRSALANILRGFTKIFTSGGSQKQLLLNEDVLNLNKRSWYHPTTGWESRATFLELFDNAVEEAAKIIHPSLKTHRPPQIPDFSFMTNLPCVDY